MALQVEGVVDGGVDAQKPLCEANRFEALHFLLPPSHDLVRVLGAIVRAQPLLMPAGQAELPERGGIGGLRRLRIFGQQDKLRADRSKGRETWA
jgi:hypothetical protein